ncbi:CDP-abequose synthase [Bacillus coahuilensis p1.1.43]|uniref:CDP-abequose synthase n=1 Tax=Bacillus coahuilensis p1.1.43 TaxID=1150625 RepID=A0A147K554_9BACI|nr:NAD(P)-dependent oxidoreductase [Bacillus coahuilensis]KUP04703.1 CDP-abequose synthase [Bacillus coahuilensis p1.1.43]
MYSLYGKKVFVTGGFGFIGSHLVRRLLLEEGANVALLARRTTPQWRLKELITEVEVHYGDLCNRETLTEILHEVRPDFVFHLAAYGLHPSQNNEIEAIQTNIIGTLNILSAAKEAGCKRVINLGSSSEYGDHQAPLSEERVLKPLDLYGSTKAAGTIIAHQIAFTSNIDIITFRPFNVFGEMEDANRLFGYIIRSILENREVKLTSCVQRRDYCYISNLIDCIIIGAKNRIVKNEIFNIGYGREYPIKYFVEEIFSHFSTNLKPHYGAIPQRENERLSPIPEITKAKVLLGWEPKVSLEEGLEKTIKWYKANYAIEKGSE